MQQFNYVLFKVYVVICQLNYMHVLYELYDGISQPHHVLHKLYVVMCQLHYVLNKPDDVMSQLHYAV